MPFRIALMGTGPVGALHAAAIQATEGLELTLSVSRDRAKAEAFAAERGVPAATDLESFLAAPDADAVWVVVPAAAMADAVIRLAATGLPLFMEKPVGLDVEETAAAAAAVDAPNMVGLNRRFYEVLRTGRERIEAAGGLRGIEVSIPENIRPLESVYSGKALHNFQYGNSVHLIDLFRFFGGEPETVETRNELRDWDDRAYLGFIRFASGARGVFQSNWYAPGPWRVSLYADDLSITYSPVERGVVHLPGRKTETIEPTGADREMKAGFAGQAAAFAQLLATGEAPDGASDLDDYLKSVRLVAALTEPEEGAGR